MLFDRLESNFAKFFQVSTL